MTLTEIEKEAENLPAAKRTQLLLFLAESLRKEQAPLPKPRLFSDDQLRAWMEEDEGVLQDAGARPRGVRPQRDRR